MKILLLRVGMVNVVLTFQVPISFYNKLRQEAEKRGVKLAVVARERIGCEKK